MGGWLQALPHRLPRPCCCCMALPARQWGPACIAPDATCTPGTSHIHRSPNDPHVEVLRRLVAVEGDWVRLENRRGPGVEKIPAVGLACHRA